MTRKRFIKKLMALGYPRNFARAIAEYSWKEGKPYGYVYFLISTYMSDFFTEI